MHVSSMSAGPSVGIATESLTLVARRGPILRPSMGSPGVFGLDLTAGCLHACPFCHIQDLPKQPSPGRVYFDPLVAGRLDESLGQRDDPPRLVVLSPMSDPLPARRDVREATARVVDVLGRRQIPLLLMTRGRIGRWLIRSLAARPALAKVAIGLLTTDRARSRMLEPAAATVGHRMRSIRRLVDAGVDVEVRLEPLIAGLTDTPEAVRPIFAELARAGARRVVANYLYETPKATARFAEVVAAAGWTEKFAEAMAGGPASPIGSQKLAKHHPVEVRKLGFARLSALGAGFGLMVEAGPNQNADLYPGRSSASA